MTRPQLVPRAMAHTELAMAVLAELGLDVDERLHMAVTLANYVRGTAVNLEPEAQAQQDTGMTNDEWMETQVPLMTEIVASGEYPMFAELADDRRPQPRLPVRVRPGQAARRAARAGGP